MSTDHHWGPRVMIFLLPEDHEQRAAAIRAYLADQLPGSYRGYSTHFTPPDLSDRRCAASHSARRWAGQPPRRAVHDRRILPFLQGE
jgi:hypothetical protein